jgi:hypothetical protein
LLAGVLELHPLRAKAVAVATAATTRVACRFIEFLIRFLHR